MADTLAPGELKLIDAYWRAANYLTVGQIYLMANPLLKEPLEPEHIKPRLLGHWGTSPGLSLVYVHMNRLIKANDTNAIYIAGPGHGGPAIVANVYLEGTYTEVYPDITMDEDGLLRLFRQFSTPGGIPSHVSVHCPGSIHEGGELGYALVHAFGAAFDNPDLVVAAVVGDGEAETGPLEGSWKGISFLDPVRDGAVLPILALNEYKIAGPTVLGRAPEEDVTKLFEGHGYTVHWVQGSEPMDVHEQMATTLDACHARIREIQADARESGVKVRPGWPMIVLRTPKGWTGPDKVDGVQIEGTFRAHQVPMSDVRRNAEHLEILEAWMRSYRPEELFDERGAPLAELTGLAPRGTRRMGANPIANGGKVRVDLIVPAWPDYAVEVEAPAAVRFESPRKMGEMMRDIMVRNEHQRNFRLFCPDETNSNRLGAVFGVTNRCLVEQLIPDDDHVAYDGKVMEVLSEHNMHGWLEGYILTGRHGLFATYEAFAMVSASMTVQHAKWMDEAADLTWRRSISALNILLTSTCWRNDHNGFSHQGPGLIDVVMSKQGIITRIYLPPDANSLLWVADHCFRSLNYVNLIVIDKQPQLQYMDADTANAHCSAGGGIWEWCSNEADGEPDIVLAAAGDIPTMEIVAAAWILQEHVPDMTVRVVNVVDLMRLANPSMHPHGMADVTFNEWFTHDVDVVFGFHGYPRAIHQVIHGRPNPNRFHVKGYAEEGTTTTPFDMVVRNGIDRFHIVLEALKRTTRRPAGADELEDYCEDMLARHERYVRDHFEDLPEIRDWVWTTP